MIGSDEENCQIEFVYRVALAREKEKARANTVKYSVRYAHLWVLLLAVFPLFFVAGPGYYSSRSFVAFWDLGHVFFFAVFSVWVTAIVPRRALERPWRLLAVLFLVVLAAGCVVEGLQKFATGRLPDPGDLLRNQLGCVTAFVWVFRAHFAQRRRLRLVQVVVVVLLLWAFWPLTRALTDESLALRSFPVLSNFETPFERYRWKDPRQTRRERNIVREGRFSMQVRLSTNKYSGTSLFYFPKDWRSYRRLHFSVYNPKNSPLELHCRIHDQEHRKYGSAFSDRYNERFAVHHGWNDLVIDLDKVRKAPKGRMMDMERIQGFGLFVVNLPEPQSLYLDALYLSR
ncbi:MAG: VanZ family protein [Desulfobulbus sp.]|jgi:VanZ family protein